MRLVSSAAVVLIACGRLGFDDTPTIEPTLTTCIRGLDSLDHHVCLVRDDGVVVCWGDSNNWQIGDGAGGGVRTVPVIASAFPSALEVHSGGFHTCVIAMDGRPWCVGANYTGQLGRGDIGPAQLEPQPIADVESGALAAGEEHGCVVVDGEVRCWGNNDHGQLGDDTTQTRGTPRAVMSLTSSLSVGCGHAFSCARSTSTVSCWGNNEFRQLGSDVGVRSLVPVMVPGVPAGVVEVALGQNHACAILRDRKLMCWGANYAGQLGREEPMTWLPPVEVDLPEAVTDVALGKDHSCARLVDASMWCFGDNSQGQVGVPAPSFERKPRRVEIPAATAITAGRFATCAAVDGGTVLCWGRGDEGQLGDGRQASSDVPVHAWSGCP